jgi:hypothetical protein
VADTPDMKVQGDVPIEYAVRVEKLSQNAAKAQGEAAVALIEDAGAVAKRPVGPNGEGSLINTTA